MIVLFPALIVLSAPGCGLLGTGSDETTVEVGTVRVIAFDHFGVPASRADVVVHDSHGEVFARAKLADDGTGEVTSVAGGTVSVAMFTDSDDLSLAKESGEITSFTNVPLDVTLHVGAPDPALGKLFDVTVQLPDFPDAPAYEVSIGCGDAPVHDPTLFTLHVPEGCGTHPRTIVATAFTPGFSPAALSVLRGVDLHQPGTIVMPAFAPLHTVDLDISGHDPAKTFYDGTITLTSDDGTFQFFGDTDNVAGTIRPEVPDGPWALTRYERQFVFDDRDDLTFSFYEQTDAGDPRSTTVPEADFLVPPVRGEGEFGFTFEGTPDFRKLDLRYRCFKCAARGRWTVFAPAEQTTLELPEMPADLKSLTPDDAFIEDISGHIFEDSELDGYNAFLNADPGAAAGTVHREAVVFLRAEID